MGMNLRNLAYRTLIRCAGHSPSALDQDSREFTQPIVLAGGAVLAASAVAGTNWFIAGYSTAENYGPAVATAVGAVTAATGVMIVATIDRAAVYQMDTQSGSRLWQALTLTAARVVVVVLVSLVTTHALAPKYLNADLKEKAFTMREESEQRRHRTLVENSPIDSLTGVVSSAASAEQKEQSALTTIPAAITQAERAAKACFAYNETQARALARRERAADERDEPARSRLRKQKAKCAHDASKAKKEREAYILDHSNKLQAAATQKQGANSEILRQRQAIDQKVAEAHEVEKDALTPASSVVLDALLASSFSARTKWYSLIIVVTMLELLALWTKLLSDKSVPGSRIAANRQIEILDHMQRVGAAKNDFEFYAALAGSFTEALARKEFREEVSKRFLAQAGALIPFEISSKIIKEIERGARNVEAAKRRHPDYAGAIAEAWSRAIQEVVDLLRKGSGPVGSPSF